MKKVTYLLIAMHSPLWFNIGINQATAQPGSKPPPEAINACQNKPVNAQCDFFGPKGQEFGFCENTPDQAFFACRPDKNADVNIPVNFTLTSSTMSDEHLLPETYTCDGESISPPLSWKNAPAGTADYAVIMHHEVAVNDNHWYWIMYDIGQNHTAIAENQVIGHLGTNSVNNLNEYAPPALKVLGLKNIHLPYMHYLQNLHLKWTKM